MSGLSSLYQFVYCNPKASLLSITFFPVCGHSTFPSFPIYVFLRCPSEFVQLRVYDGNPSAPSYCICLFFFSAHFAEWRHILFFNECQSSSLSSFPHSFKSSTNSRWLVDSPSLPNMHLASHFLRTIDRDIKQNSNSKKLSAWNMPRRILTSATARLLTVYIVFQFCVLSLMISRILEAIPTIYSVSKTQ